MGLKFNAAPSINRPPDAELFEDDIMESDLPHLYAFMRDIQYEGGRQRVTGTISFFVMGGALKCAVNDKDRALCSFVTAPTWAELLQLVNDGIGNDSLDWKTGNKIESGKKPPY